jgi:hypothetical protein
MTDITTVLAALATEQVTLQSALTAATAQGAQASSVATATRTASAAVQALAARTQAEQTQVAASGATVAAALAARTTALTAATAATAAGAPLSDDAEKDVKKAVFTANNVSEADLDAKGVAAVTTLDSTIAGLGIAEKAALVAAQTDLATKQAALLTARNAALALLATIQGSASDVTARLNAATANRTEATQLAAGADAASHHAAVVAFADYAVERTSLTGDIAADPQGAVLQGKWTTAANAWLSALADVAAAGEAVIAAQLALDTVMATQSAKQQTRYGDAAAAVGTAFGP